MNHTTVAIVIIIAVTALLITASSVSQSDVFAKKKSHRYSHHKSQYVRFFQDANSGIGQRNDQSSVCISGFAIGGSCNNVAANANAGNAVGTNVGNGGSGHSSQGVNSGINQHNKQTSVCISPGSVSLSCTNTAANINTGSSVGANVFP